MVVCLKAIEDEERGERKGKMMTRKRERKKERKRERKERKERGGCCCKRKSEKLR